MDKMTEKAIDHVMNHSKHRAGIVYDFIMVCNSKLGIPRKYKSGITLTVVEMCTLLTIAENPGITASSLCRKWNRTRSALSQLLKKMEQKGLIYKEKSKDHDRIMLLFPTEEGLKIRDSALENEYEDMEHLFSSLIQMGCTGEELASFYKVVDCYTELLLQNPKTGWEHLITNKEKQ